jgi:hypothetical protein
MLRLKGELARELNTQNVANEELFDANDLNDTVLLDDDPRSRRTTEAYRLSNRTYNRISEITDTTTVFMRLSRQETSDFATEHESKFKSQ